jgi:hypothetical protein
MSDLDFSLNPFYNKSLSFIKLYFEEIFKAKLYENIGRKATNLQVLLKIAELHIL